MWPATLVSKSASFARPCITKLARTTITTTTTVARTARCTGQSNPRPYYTMVGECATLSGMTTSSEITSPFHASSIDFAYPKLLPQRNYPREILFLGGAPGAGKGTNSSHIANLRRYSAPTIVVSDLLNTPACRLLKDHGAMVDDDFVFNVLLKELEKSIYRNGVVVDGFPRTATQAEYLTNFYEQQCDSSSFLQSPPRILFVMLHVDETASIERQQSRGRKTMEMNKERENKGMDTIPIRLTDTDLSASKARYTVFEEQLKAVMGLGSRFPLALVHANAPVDVVKSNLSYKITSDLPVPF